MASSAGLATKQDLVQWTNAQAIPTVALAKLVRGDAEQRLILPGNIQPYYKAAIYARVSGYLKSWQQDIGAHVKAGQVLASIDTPDLDQQLAQAKADSGDAPRPITTSRQSPPSAATRSCKQQVVSQQAD